MKITHVNLRYGYEGGVEEYLHEVTLALVKNGHEVSFVCSQIDKGTSYLSESNIFKIPELAERDSEPNKKTARILKETLCRISPDLIFLHHSRNPYYIKAMREIAPIVRFAHGEDVICPNRDKSFIPKWEGCNYKSGIVSCGVLCPYLHRYGSRHPLNIIKRLQLQRALRSGNTQIDRWVVASQYISQSLEREGILKETIELIPYFTELPEKFIEAPNKKKLLFVGRLVPGKGVQYLLEAFHFLDQNCLLDIAGDGPMKDELKKLAAPFGDRVIFHGKMTHSLIQSLWNNCDVVVVPSIFQEPFGIVGIEAMAHGRPVVAFDVGGISDWLTHGETGFIIKAKDVKLLADNIRILVNDPNLANHFGKKGRERVRELYQVEHHMVKLTNTFDKARNVHNLQTH